MSLESFVFRYRTEVHFGVNSIDRIDVALSQIRQSRALIVTGARSAKVSGALDKVIDALSRAGVSYELFSGIRQNPTVDQVEEGVELCRSVRPDVLIAIGGGSVIDACKAMSAVYCSETDVLKVFYGESEIRCSKPVIAVNLTHGTGSEVDRFAVLTDPRSRIKRPIVSDHLYPRFSIDDPRLTVTLPRDHTVYTSIDALYHALESSSSVHSSPLTRHLSRQVVELITRYLRRAYERGDDIEARYWLLYASMVAGVCIDNSRAHIAHAVEHAVSGMRPDVPHGLGLAVVGPALMELTFRARPENLFEVLSHVIPDLRCRPEDSRRVRQFLEDLARQFGVEPRLSTLKMGRDDVDEIVSLTYRASSRILEHAPLKVTPEILRSALEEIA